MICGISASGLTGEKKEHDAWNRATDSRRQSGSSIKPLSVYAPAFESGAITPATVIKDLPISYSESGPYPLNDTRSYSYARTIYRAVVRSVNAVAANTLDKSGESYAYKFVKDKFRLSTLVESYEDAGGQIHSDIGVGPLALGAQTIGVTVRDMSSAFAAFANDGLYRSGRTFTKVYDSKGNLIIDNVQEKEQILTKKTVDYMNYCLTAATKASPPSRHVPRAHPAGFCAVPSKRRHTFHPTSAKACADRAVVKALFPKFQSS